MGAGDLEIREGACLRVRGCNRRNEITGQLQVGKRIDILRLEEAVAVREATLLTTIDHSNIVPVTEVVKVSDYPMPMKVIELSKRILDCLLTPFGPQHLLPVGL